MTIRTFQPGDDVAQVSHLQRGGRRAAEFQARHAGRAAPPAARPGLRRRPRGSTPWPTAGRSATPRFAANGRVSFPWCRKGHEAVAEPLLRRRPRGDARARPTARLRRLPRRLAGPARSSRPTASRQTREMVNFVIDIVEMPTPAARRAANITPVTAGRRARHPPPRGRRPARRRPPRRSKQHLFRNPYFSAASLFALRSRSGDDAGRRRRWSSSRGLRQPRPGRRAPCPASASGRSAPRGMTHKRINGLFSFLAADARELSAYAPRPARLRHATACRTPKSRRSPPRSPPTRRTCCASTRVFPPAGELPRLRAPAITNRAIPPVPAPCPPQAPVARESPCRSPPPCPPPRQPPPPWRRSGRRRGRARRARPTSPSSSSRRTTSARPPTIARGRRGAAEPRRGSSAASPSRSSATAARSRASPR